MKTRRAINKEELKNALLELMSEDADFRREISVRLLREEPVTRSYLDESLIKLSKQFDDKLLELRREIAEENKAMRAEFWEEMRKLREEMARENQAMRAEFWEEIRKFREEMARENQAMRAEFWEEIRKLREELNAQVLALRKDGEAMRAEFWEEIRKLREEMARENQAMRTEFWEEIKKLREEMAKENQAMRAEFWREMNKFREEFTESLKQFERSFNIRLSIVGNRWGINAEMAFKEGMKTIVEKEFGWKVTKWRYEGILSDIHPKRDKYEIDVVISDSEVILAEIKGSASEADVLKFYDNVRAYERVNGVKAKRKVMIVALAYPDARLEAQKYGIELISPSTFPEIPIEFIL
jgi:hypothetical protein